MFQERCTFFVAAGAQGGSETVHRGATGIPVGVAIAVPDKVDVRSINLSEDIAR